MFQVVEVIATRVRWPKAPLESETEAEMVIETEKRIEKAGVREMMTDQGEEVAHGAADEIGAEIVTERQEVGAAAQGARGIRGGTGVEAVKRIRRGGMKEAGVEIATVIEIGRGAEVVGADENRGEIKELWYWKEHFINNPAHGMALWCWVL